MHRLLLSFAVFFLLVSCSVSEEKTVPVVPPGNILPSSIEESVVPEATVTVLPAIPAIDESSDTDGIIPESPVSDVVLPNTPSQTP